MVSLSDQDVSKLKRAIYDALFRALCNPSQTEPQLVANLVWQLPCHLNKIRLIDDPKTKVSAGGVFVHAQPYVTCSSFPKTKPESVEIGDLLLIRTLVQSKAVVERRALLLQAKKVDDIPAVPDNPNQWHLYERWSEFTYAPRSVGLTGQKRHIKEPDMYNAAKYLLLDRHQHMCHSCKGWDCYHCRNHSIRKHYTAQPTSPDISNYRVFADEILDFLISKAGKRFIDPAPFTKGWDQVICDLTKMTANAKTKYMGRAATGQEKKFPRGNGTLCFMRSAGQSSSHDSYYLVANSNDATDSDQLPEASPEVPDEWGQDDEGSGISTIEVIVEQGDD